METTNNKTANQIDWEHTEYLQEVASWKNISCLTNGHLFELVELIDPKLLGKTGFVFLRKENRHNVVITTLVSKTKFDAVKFARRADYYCEFLNK